MPPEPQMDKPQQTSAATPGYETSDANVKGVYGFLVTLGLVLVVTAIVCWGMFRFYSYYFGVTISASAPFVDSRQVPTSGPQLQVNARQDLLRYQDEQQRSLESFAWVNQASGTVQVPIEQAMDLLVKKGLPVQGEAPAAPAAAPEGKPKPAAVGGKKP